MARRVKTIEQRFAKRPQARDLPPALEIWGKDDDQTDKFLGGWIRDASGVFGEYITDLAEYKAALKKAGISDD